MNNSQIATAVAMRDLNCFSIDTINERILLQKKIYLAQDLGLPLGYGYSWYIHGPYSTDLTAIAYQIIPEGDEAIEGKTLKQPYADMIKKVNDLEKIIDEKQLQISVVQWYELLASIAYWIKSENNDDKEVIKNKIKETKPQFSEDQILEAFSSYTEFRTVA